MPVGTKVLRTHVITIQESVVVKQKGRLYYIRTEE